MKWNRCRRLPEVSLLAAGALGEDAKIELERHLAECLECRIYFAEIRSLVEPLGAWEKGLSKVEVTPAARLRWERAVKNERAVSAGAHLNTAPFGAKEPLSLTLSPLGGARGSEACMGAVSRCVPSAARVPALRVACRVVWWELIGPSRYAWMSMAALWLAMWVINGNLSGHRAGEMGRVAVSPQEMLQNREEQNRVLAELAQPAFGFVAPAPAPAFLRPRSERARDWEII